MKVVAYLRLVSDEDTIRKIHEATHVPGASIKQTKAHGGMVWNWGTPYIEINEDDIDAEINALLLSYRPLFPVIKQQRNDNTDFYLEMVTHYKSDEEPRGLYLSPATISLLSEAGAALDNDIVRGAENYKK